MASRRVSGFVRVECDLGITLQQDFGLCAVASDIRAEAQARLTGIQSLDGDGLGIHLRCCRLSLGTSEVKNTFA
jgi:hypothetical protein